MIGIVSVVGMSSCIGGRLSNIAIKLMLIAMRPEKTSDCATSSCDAAEAAV